VEAYYVDNNRYPTDRSPRPVGDPAVLGTETLGYELSTPIAYITSLDISYDVFKREAKTSDARRRYNWRNTLGLATNPASTPRSPRYLPEPRGRT
jgi:hypothetical protein